MLCARRDEWLASPASSRCAAADSTAEAMRCDVSNAADVQAVVDSDGRAVRDRSTSSSTTRGVSWGERPEAMTLAQWQKVIDVNLTGAFICSQAAGREMLKRQLWTHHQHRVDCRYAGKRERPVLRRLTRRARPV